MTRSALPVFAAALLALCAVGCSAVKVEFRAPDDPREPLERTMRLSYRFRYDLAPSGLLPSLFSPLSEPRLEAPRLLYSLDHDAFDGDEKGFTDTGAAFDPGSRTALWDIASPRKLHGRRALFVLTADNAEQPAVTRVSFPEPGRVTDVQLSWEPERLVFRLLSEGEVYDPAFRLKLWNRTERPITVTRREDGAYVWRYPGEIEPSETRSPLSFRVDYRDWYKKPALEPFITSPIYMAPAVSFDEARHSPGSPDRVELSFRAWGRTGLVSFRWSKDGKTFHPARGVSDPALQGEVFRAAWNLAEDGLGGYTGSLTLEARHQERVLGRVEILPPGPSIRILSAVQEDHLVRLGLRLGFVPPASLQVFAGTGAHQRELRADELVSRAADALVFRHADLPREPDGRLFLFLSARNAAGLASAEKQIQILSLSVASVRQEGRSLLLSYDAVPPGLPVTLSYRTGPAAGDRPARSVRSSPGRLAWDVFSDLGAGSIPDVLHLRLRAERGASHVTAQAQAAPLGAVLGKPERGAGGLYRIPCRLSGTPDGIKFSYRAGGGPFVPARSARFLPSRSEVQWSLWDDLRLSTYGGGEVVLRLTLQNRHGAASFDSAALQPLYVRVTGSSQRGRTMEVTVEASPRVQSFRFFYSFADRGAFRPLEGVERRGRTFSFDLGRLGRTYSTFLRLRVVGLTAGGDEVEDSATLKLVAGFEPSAAAWHGKHLWVSYTVSWKVSEDDVTFSCLDDRGRTVRASTPMKRVFDVNHRAVAWDVYADLVRLSIFDLSRVRFRIDIRDPDRGAFASVVSFDRLPLPPLRLEGTRVLLVGSSLAFAFERLGRPPGQPAYAPRDYRIEAEYFCPDTKRFRKAQPASGPDRDGRFVWDRRQSLEPVRAGTWVRLVVTRRNAPEVVGVALFRIALAADHPFFRKDEEY